MTTQDACARPTTLGTSLQSSNEEAVRTGPGVLGWPLRRQRALMVGINLMQLVWAGPASSEAVQADFAAKFFRPQRAHPRSLMLASEAEIVEEYQALARRRGFAVEPEEVKPQMDETLLAKLCSPGALLRRKEWQGVRAESGNPRFFVSDLDQHPRNRGGGGNDKAFPVLITHGSLLVDDDETETSRFLTSYEHLSLQGFSMHGAAPSVMRQVAMDLSIPQRKAVAGNGMHVPTMACWMYYVLSNIIPREALRPGIPRSRSWECHDEDTDDERLLPTPS